MANNRSYKRYFIILDNDTLGFGNDSKKQPKGYVKIEVRDEKATIDVHLQDLKYFKNGEYIYRNYLVSTKGKGRFVDVGSILIDEKGRGEQRKKIDPNNIEGSGMPIEDFNVVAIIAEPLKRSEEKKEIISPLVGYINKEKVDWKPLLNNNKEKEQVETIEQENVAVEEVEENIEVEEIEEAEENVEIEEIEEAEENVEIEDVDEETEENIEVEDIIEESNEKEEEIEIVESVEAEENIEAEDIEEVEENVEAEDIQENKESEENIEMEDIVEEIEENNKPEENAEELDEYEEKIKKIMEAIEEGAKELYKEKDDKPQVESEELEIEDVSENEEVSEAEDVENEEFEEVEDLEENKEIEDIEEIEENIENIENIESEEAEENLELEEEIEEVEEKVEEQPIKEDIMDKEVQEEVKTKKYKEFKAKTKMNMGKGPFMANQNSNYEKYYDMVHKYVQDMLKYSEDIEPFSKNIKGCRWWKMEYNQQNMYRGFLPFFGYILNIYYYNPYIFYMNNCDNLMDKYGHYIFGICYDENKQPKYYVYGVPGRYLYKEQPFRGMTGFVYWHPMEDKQPQRGDYGYWLLHLDARTGNVVFPFEPTIPPMY